MKRALFAALALTTTGCLGTTHFHSGQTPECETRERTSLSDVTDDGRFFDLAKQCEGEGGWAELTFQQEPIHGGLERWRCRGLRSSSRQP